MLVHSRSHDADYTIISFADCITSGSTHKATRHASQTSSLWCITAPHRP